MSEVTTVRAPKKISKITRAFLISLVVVILCSLVNWGIVTGWGNVKISRINLTADNGMTYSALLYVPQNATNETPAPGVLMFPGAAGNARNHESWAVEFARRGYVCLAIDNRGSGDAEFSNSLGPDAIHAAPDLFTRYFLQLPFVNPDQVATSGHSAGAISSVAMAVKYQTAVCMCSDGAGMGNTTPFNGDMLYVVGLADKGNPLDAYGKTARDSFILNGVDVPDDPIVPGTVYGSFEDGNASMLLTVPDQVHEGAFISKGHIEALLYFTQQAMPAPNYIDAADQVWMWKDVVGLIGMFAFAISLMLLALTLVEEVPVFSVIKQPLPRNIGMRKGAFAVSACVAVLFPVLVLYTGAFGLLDFIGGRKANTSIFQMLYTNYGFSFVVALNIFGAVMFLLYHFTWGRKKFHATARDYGLTVEGKRGLSAELILKAALVAVITVVCGWTYLAIQGAVFGTDFYCLFFGYKPIVPVKLWYALPYIVVWVLCFLVAALGMNVERRLPSTGNEKADTAIAVCVNVVIAAITVTLVVIIENAIQIHLGATGTALSTWKTDITRLWGMPVSMAIGAGGNTYLYRKTGNIWLGAIMMGIICALGACLYGQVQY